MQPDGGQPRCPGPPVPQAEAPLSARVSQYRPAREDVLDELGAGSNTPFLLSTLLGLHVVPQETPPIDAQFPHVLQNLGSLETQPLGDDEASSPPYPIGLDPGKVPIAADLLLLRPLSVYSHRAVAHDKVDLLLRGGVLQVLKLLVDRNLLLEPLHPLPGGPVGADSKLPPYDVGNEDAEGLGRPSG